MQYAYIKKFLSVRWLSKKGDKTLKLEYLSSATGRVLTQLNWPWIGQTLGLYIQSLHVKMREPFPMPHPHYTHTFTCDSALQRSHCWRIFKLSITGGMSLVFCASVLWCHVTFLLSSYLFELKKQKQKKTLAGIHKCIICRCFTSF